MTELPADYVATCPACGHPIDTSSSPPRRLDTECKQSPCDHFDHDLPGDQSDGEDSSGEPSRG